jgi:hypothetical protein
MRTRSNPLPPPPDRAPYFAVLVDGTRITLRTPSLHAVGEFVDAIGDRGLKRIVGVVALMGQGSPRLLPALASAPDVLALFACGIGIAWADPVVELEAGPWNGRDPALYGKAVFDELHDAGWKLPAIVAAGLRIAALVREASQLDREVTDQAAFFLPPRVLASASASKPSAPSSEGDPAPSTS